jgi:hypothetical protein
MDLREKALAFFLVFVLLFSMVSASHGAAKKDLVISKCQAFENASTVEAPNGVTLNGGEVHEINCSNIESYKFHHKVAEMPGAGMAPSSPDSSTVALVFLSPVVFFAAAVMVSWRSVLGWKKTFIYFLGAIASFLAEIFVFAVIGELSPGASLPLLLLPVMLSLLTVPSYLLYRGDIESPETRSEVAVSFLFVAGFNWAILFLLLMAPPVTTLGA